MISITPQSRRIVIFLVTTLLIGCSVRLAQHYLSDRPPEISIVSPEPSGGDLTDALAPDSQAVKPPERININTAGPDQLQSLSGIGPHLARRIVEYRDQHGPFSKTIDITSVPGIGEKTYQRLRERITIASGKEERAGQKK